MSDWIPSPANALILLASLVLAYVFISKIKAKGAFLCEDCKFNREDLCLKAERPHATQCTSYRQGPVAAPSGTTTGEVVIESKSEVDSN